MIYVARHTCRPSVINKLIATFSHKRLDFEPGKKWSYSNSGCIVLGKIIEVASGGSYNRFLRSNILEAVGMADSGYDFTGDVIKNRAQGYETTRQNAAYIVVVLSNLESAPIEQIMSSSVKMMVTDSE